MTAGDILKGQILVVETFKVKEDANIKLGEIVCAGATGIEPATGGSNGPFFVSLEDHIYANEEQHEIECVVAGCVEALRALGYEIRKGWGLCISMKNPGMLDANFGGMPFVAIAQKDSLGNEESIPIWIGIHPGGYPQT